MILLKISSNVIDVLGSKPWQWQQLLIEEDEVDDALLGLEVLLLLGEVLCLLGASSLSSIQIRVFHSCLGFSFPLWV